VRAVLEPLGLSALEESIYLALLRGGPWSVNSLGEHLGAGVPRVRASLARLEDFGFVTRSSGTPARPLPVPPEVAVRSLADRRRRELDDVQTAGDALAARFPESGRTQPDELVEVVTGRQAVAVRFGQVARSATGELRILDRPPYVQAVSEENVSETDALDRGVTVRGIYAPEAFELPGAFEEAMQALGRGEQARVHPAVPMKLVVADDSTAMLPLSSQDAVESAVVLHAPMVVAALGRLFELLWRQASPLPRWSPDAPADDPVDTELIALLGTGLKDEAIARELQISIRTLGRRMSGLLDSLGARTRFQAGVQAARRGLL
jgi:sugar-specific transcriptional regulator TrmB